MDCAKVYVVDDDDAVREALRTLFRSAGLRVEAFDSALAFLRCYKPEPNACLVLDIRMPAISGTALHDELVTRGIRLPVIFITGHGDVATAVSAIKKGAYDFIEKPFDDGRLVSQVLSAIEDHREGRHASPAVQERLALLSEREREVLDRVLEGKPSRQIGDELFISVKTVEFHRARIMQKLGVRSTAELFRACFSRG